jgi:DNA (cytosine-5)-methyltransferase 1
MENAGQKIKIATVCSGIGSPEQALKELHIPHKISFACEIDKYARQTYLANFTPNQMYTDLTAEEWDKPEQYSDLFIGGIPCQAFSLAGKRLGELDKRGLLFYDFYRYVKNQQPKVFIIENVKGLLSDNNGITFQNWCALLGQSMNTHLNMFNHDDSLLYNLHFKVLNSKDFGVPQNRERVFLIGIRNDLPNTFRFPIGERLKIRLKDILESEVDEKYYLSEKMIEVLSKHGNNIIGKNDNPEKSCTIHSAYFKMGGRDQQYVVQESVKIAHVSRSDEGKKLRSESIKKGKDFTPFQAKKIDFKESDVMNTITCATTKDNLIMVKEATKQGYAIAKEGDSINLSNPNSETRRGRVGNQIANTLDTACNQGVVVNEAPKLMMMESLEGGKWDKMHESIRRYYSPDGISPTVTAMGGGNHEPKVLVDEIIQLNNPKHSQQRIYSSDGISPTISAGNLGGGQNPCKHLTQESRIRRLTPLECMRLQGYPDSFIKPCSDSQTYKQAGNSITVNVMKAIIKNLISILC